MARRKPTRAQDSPPDEAATPEPIDKPTDPVGDGDTLEAVDSETYDPLEDTLADFDACHEFYGERHRQMDENLRFSIDQQLYLDDSGNTRDRTEAQPHDLTLLNMLRRKWSQHAKTPIYYQVRPHEKPQSPAVAELIKAVLDRELFDPRRMYKRNRRRMLIGGYCSGSWQMSAEWNGQIGDVTYRSFSSSMLHVMPGWLDMHDPSCPCVLEEVDYTVAQLKMLGRPIEDGGAGWDIPEDLKPDVSEEIGTIQRGGDPSLKTGQVRLDTARRPFGPGGAMKKTVRVYKAWWRYDPDGIEEAEDRQPTPLPDETKYMFCPQCGHEVYDHPRDEEGKLPVVGTPCPECQKQADDTGDMHANVPDLERAEVSLPTDYFEPLRTDRLIVVLKEARHVAYDDRWPYTKPDGRTLRSFPFATFEVYLDPRQRFAKCDVDWQWTQALLFTDMLRFGYEQMSRNVDLIIAPFGKLVDSKRRAYRFGDTPGGVAYLTEPQWAESIKHFQGSGIPSGWGEFYQALNNSFFKNLGTGELGLAQDLSRNVPVGTVRAIQESGEIPTDDHIEQFAEEEGIFLGVVADMIQCCWTEAKWVRMSGTDGSAEYKEISGADLVDADVMITRDPSLTIIDSEKQDALMKWMNQPKPQRQMTARLAGIDASLVQEYEQLIAQSEDGAPKGPSKEQIDLIKAMAALVTADPSGFTEDQIQWLFTQAGGPAPKQGAVMTATGTKARADAHKARLESVASMVGLNGPPPNGAQPAPPGGGVAPRFPMAGAASG